MYRLLLLICCWLVPVNCVSNCNNDSTIFYLLITGGGLSHHCINSTSINCTFNSLQNGLNFAASLSGPCNVVNVQLAPGEHIISHPVLLWSSVSINSLSHNIYDTTIKCVFQQSQVPDSIQHSLYFNQSTSVEIADISVESCALPFRVDSVMKVRIENVVFR